MIKAIFVDFYGVLERGGSLNKPLMTLLASLGQQFKLGIISNSAGKGMMTMFTDEEQKLFDTVVLSGAIGVEKPNPKIFIFALQQLEVLPEESIFIDDIESLCQAARRLGFRTIHYKDFDQCKSELYRILAYSNN